MDLIGLILIGEDIRSLESVLNYLEILQVLSLFESPEVTTNVLLTQEFTSLFDSVEVTSNVTI